ncbi:FHY3/FAR1 family [Trema orientale]|uniref:Protein FAR1-RELATED SEQUENCE n=1 Tax=Trema orientale TaxID=63057 RepID=A0A2P5BDQ1_TREOI|nr:FHY3/FAR1 family [Trema orientale]
MKMWEFVRAIDLSLSWMCHCEAKDDFDTLNSALLLGRTNIVEIEKQAATVYTRAMFYKVRDQILKEGKYMITSTRRYGDKVTYNLTKYNAKIIRRTVVHDMTMDAYECECCYFLTLDVPCRHIFAIMKNEHVIHLPDSLIVSHWTMKAKENLTNNFVSAKSCKNSCSEERARGAPKGLKRCTLCNKIGHNKTTCARKNYVATECSEIAFTTTTTNDYDVREIHLGEDKEAWTIMGDICKRGSVQIDACKYPVQYTGMSSEYEPTEDNPNFSTPTYSWNTETTTTNLDIPTSEVENLNTSWWGTPYGSRS